MDKRTNARMDGRTVRFYYAPFNLGHKNLIFPSGPKALVGVKGLNVKLF